MKLTDVIIAIIALVLAFYIIQFVLAVAFFVFRIIAILVIAFIVYLFLKKVL